MSNLSKELFKKETGLSAESFQYEYQNWMENKLNRIQEDEIAKNQAHEEIAKVMDMEHHSNFIG